MPFSLCPHLPDSCPRIDGHCFLCLFDYLSKHPRTVEIRLAGRRIREDFVSYEFIDAQMAIREEGA